MYSRKLALSQAKRFRTCPPPEIRKNPEHNELMQRHRTICPYCSTDETHDPEIWNILAQKIQSFSSSQTPAADTTDIRGGQIRQLSDAMGRWHNDRYYHPPCAMVLEVSPSASGNILVAQIYHDITLASEGDLILHPHQTGLAALFVECWNTYFIRDDQAGPLLGKVSSEILQAVRRLKENPDALPDWAELPRPLTENDPRSYFRELELEVAEIFSTKATDERSRKAHSTLSQPSLSCPDTEKAIAEIRAMIPMVKWPIEPVSPEEVFALADFPADRIPLAAADSDIQTIIAKLIVIHDHAVISIEPLAVEIYMTHPMPEGFAVSGRITGLYETEDDLRLICFATLSEKKYLPASKSELDIKTGSFASEFQTDVKRMQKLNIAVVHYAK